MERGYMSSQGKMAIEWLPNPSPVMLIYALIVPPSFLVRGKQHLSLAIDYFSLPNWWWTDIYISSTKAQAAEAGGPEEMYVVGRKREQDKFRMYNSADRS